MDRTPNKRKSLAKANTTPNKVQKTAVSPVSQKKNNKSPKFANKNQKSPQKKQMNGKQNTPKGKKSKATEEYDPELSDDSEEDESNSSIEQAENTIETQEDSDNSEGEDSDEDDDESDDKTTDKVKANKPEQFDRKLSVYVGGLSYSTTETEIRAHFSDCSLASVKLLRVPGSLKSKGSAFVNLSNEAGLQKALLKNGSEMNGRTIQVSEPKPHVTGIERKKLLLAKLKRKVQNLEKELGEGPTKKEFNKKPHFGKKNFPNKKAIK